MAIARAARREIGRSSTCDVIAAGKAAAPLAVAEELRAHHGEHAERLALCATEDVVDPARIRRRPTARPRARAPTARGSRSARRTRSSPARARRARRADRAPRGAARWRRAGPEARARRPEATVRVARGRHGRGQCAARRFERRALRSPTSARSTSAAKPSACPRPNDSLRTTTIGRRGLSGHAGEHLAHRGGSCRCPARRRWSPRRACRSSTQRS